MALRGAPIALSLLLGLSLHAADPAHAKDDLATLISDLEHSKDEGRRGSAARKLRDMGPEAKEAVPALVRAMEDSSRSVRE
ncbi:MAG: hypothetical protein ACYTG4_05770, partial [Planctomycetota bacterium]